MSDQRNRLVRFFAYNNAVPIVFSIFFLSVSAAAASTPQVQEAVVQKNESVRSVDNSYIRNANLDAFEVVLTIESITESELAYEVTYSYNSIGLEDFVWQPLTKRKTLTVTKEALDDRDLGLYVADQLGQVVASEQKYLKEAQAAERALGSTQKVVVTEYAGLIGKHLKPQAQVFDGYEPVVKEEVEVDDEPDRIAAGVGSVSVPKSEQVPAPAPAPQPKPVEEQVKDILDQHEDDALATNDDSHTATTTTTGGGTTATTTAGGGTTSTTTPTNTTDTATTTPPVDDPSDEDTATTTPTTDTASSTDDGTTTEETAPDENTTETEESDTAPPEEEAAEPEESAEEPVDDPEETEESDPPPETDEGEV